MKEENLLFIISQPRSGSTLLQKLIMTSGQIASCSEPWWLLQQFGHDVSGLIQGLYDESLAHHATKSFKNIVGFDQYRSAQTEFILKVYNLAKGDKEFFLDKTPRYYEILNELETSLPKAKKILLVRHPLDVLSSILNTWVTKESLLGNFYRDLCLAPFVIMEQVQKQNPNEICVKYEDFIANRSVLERALYSLNIKVEIKENLINHPTWMMGDKGEKSELKEVLPDNTGNWKKYTRSKKWGKFMMGYAHFLGEDYFRFYGYDFPEQARKTKRFSTFLREGKNQLHNLDLSRKVFQKLRANLNL